MLGMLAAHVGFSAEFDWLQPESWASLVHGRSSILFALIAGVSLSLLTRQRTLRTVEETRVLRLRIVGRGVTILAIGLALELLGTPILVILTMYGVLFVIAVPFLGWSTRRLLIAAIALAVAGPPLLALAQSVTADSWAAGVTLLIFGSYPLTVWIALLFAGLAIGRLRLGDVAVAVKLLVVGTVLATLGYGLGVLAQPGPTLPNLASSGMTDASSKAVPVSPEALTGWSCTDAGFVGTVQCYDPAVLEASGGYSDSAWVEPTGFDVYVDRFQHADWEGAVTALGAWGAHTGGTLELLGSGGLAIAILGLCLLLGRAAPRVFAPIGALGAMPLSAYSMHVLMFAFVLPLIPLSEGLMWLVLASTLVVMATVWRRFAGTGPLERLARRVGDIFAVAPRKSGSSSIVEAAQPASS